MDFIKKITPTTIIKIIVGILIIAGIIFSYNMYVKAKEYDKVKAKLDEAITKVEKLTKENGQLAIDLAKAKKDYMELGMNSKVETVVQYVEKTSPNDADVALNKKPPKVIVTAGDGKEYDFTPDAKSAQVIKDGKVVLTEDNTLKLDIETIVDARFKDRVDAINAKHDLEMKEKNAELDKINRKLKITRKQRDFYAGTLVVGTAGVVGYNIYHKNF